MTPPLRAVTTVTSAASVTHLLTWMGTTTSSAWAQRAGTCSAGSLVTELQEAPPEAGEEEPTRRQVLTQYGATRPRDRPPTPQPSRRCHDQVT